MGLRNSATVSPAPIEQPETGEDRGQPLSGVSGNPTQTEEDRGQPLDGVSAIPAQTEEHEAHLPREESAAPAQPEDDGGRRSDHSIGVKGSDPSDYAASGQKERPPDKPNPAATARSRFRKKDTTQFTRLVMAGLPSRNTHVRRPQRRRTTLRRHHYHPHHHGPADTASLGSASSRRTAKVVPVGDDTEVDVQAYEEIRRTPGLEFLSQDAWKEINDEEDEVAKLDMLKRMRTTLSNKRILRDKLSLDAISNLRGCDACRYKQKMACIRCGLRLGAVGEFFTFWKGSVKTIEGHYGSGVAAFFVFLKWLFLHNVYIFLLFFVFVVIPQFAFSVQDYDPAVSGNTSDARLNISYECSKNYTVTTPAGNDVAAYILDFLQGTGWMEKTLLFYGHYTTTRLAIGTFDGTTHYYTMPLAYIFVTIVVFIISLVLMARQTAQGFRTRRLESENKYFQYCNLAFSGWDYGLNDPKTSVLKHKALYGEMTSDLQEQRAATKRHTRTGCRKCGLYTARVVINLFVIAVLGASGYLIYYATTQSLNIKEGPDFAGYAQLVQLLVEYVPSITITVLNVLVRLIFQKVVQGEDYGPEKEIVWTLGRTVFLRLASLAVLIVTIYTQISGASSHPCTVGDPPLRCWETYAGQQIYKLMILDFFLHVALVFFVDFPRMLVVKHCSCKVSRLVGMPEFVIPQNVLDLVYAQLLCWLGAFFAPLIPAISVVSFFLLFYLKKLTCLYNYVPSDRPYRASKSHSFFMFVLMAAFAMCCIPVGYVILRISPSTGCGPFRIYTEMWEIVTITMATWPNWLQSILDFISSELFIIPLIVVLMLIVYYFYSMSIAHKDTVKLMKQQIVMEGHDKHYLLARINQLSSQAPPCDQYTETRVSKTPLSSQDVDLNSGP